MIVPLTHESLKRTKKEKNGKISRPQEKSGRSGTVKE